MRPTQRPSQEVEGQNSTASYYGLSKLGWESLTPEQREMHYNRHKPCEHDYVFSGPEQLREQQSFDPYFNTPHMRPHSVELFFKGLCDCQTCAVGIGIPREDDRRKIDVQALRERLTPHQTE